MFCTSPQSPPLTMQLHNNQLGISQMPPCFCRNCIETALTWKGWSLQSNNIKGLYCASCFLISLIFLLLPAITIDSMIYNNQLAMDDLGLGWGWVPIWDYNEPEVCGMCRDGMAVEAEAQGRRIMGRNIPPRSSTNQQSTARTTDRPINSAGNLHY